jgi:hypothetical protein
MPFRLTWFDVLVVFFGGIFNLLMAEHIRTRE